MDVPLVVVIPCHDEPDMLGTLDSLWMCHAPPCRVEVVVVINGSLEDAPSVRSRNRMTQVSTRAWMEAHETRTRANAMPWRFHLLCEMELPVRQAGVGTARKLGMDWAMTRFSPAEQDSGVLVCLDADCRVAPNYLRALHDHFCAHPQTPGCALYFEHVLANLPPHQRRGMVHYELFLRYYVHGLRWSGFPHAFHTVGSSMAVRAAPYRRQGGMNRRKAGEDFYFLQKIIPLGGFSDLRETTVFPSARVSHRVPFGTGRAMAEWLAGRKDPGMVYDPRVFQGLGRLFSQVARLHEGIPPAQLSDLPPILHAFLEAQRFADHMAEIRANTTSLPAFRKRFFHRINAFYLLKYIHFATERAWEKCDIQQASTTLLHWMDAVPEGGVVMESEALLKQYRRLDRTGYWYGRSGLIS